MWEIVVVARGFRRVFIERTWEHESEVASMVIKGGWAITNVGHVGDSCCSGFRRVFIERTWKH